jgi:ABC-2 type transport system ATP-binding protein
MEEAQNLCNQVAIMDQGRIIALGSPAKLIKTFCKGVTITLPDSENRANLESLFASVQMRNGNLELQTDNVTETISKLISAEINLSEMSVRSPNLEDVFLTLTGKRLRD